ncbi:MAG: carbamoyltransferase, partial [Gemmatimonadales bacterium]|nr:carbamoyltransferase [Gemmatimonadales bacterium]NIS64154.1 carbamoyltransferase [Gemmatimonadales bacterium]
MESTFVHPGMSDEGLAVGAALAVDAQLNGRPPQPRLLPNVYLGHAYGDDEIARVLADAGLEATHLPGRVET